MIPIHMNPWVKLLEETMRKADEAFDVMEMFPEEVQMHFNQVGQQRLMLQQQELQQAQMQMQLTKLLHNI